MLFNHVWTWALYRNSEVLPLTAHPGADFKSFKSFLEALHFMLDKEPLQAELSDDETDWQYDLKDDIEDVVPPPPPPHLPRSLLL